MGGHGGALPPRLGLVAPPDLWGKYDSKLVIIAVQMLEISIIAQKRTNNDIKRQYKKKYFD